MGFKFTYTATVDLGDGKEPHVLFYLEDGYAEVYPGRDGHVYLELNTIVNEPDHGPMELHPLPRFLIKEITTYLWKHYDDQILEAASEQIAANCVYAEALPLGSNVYKGEIRL